MNDAGRGDINGELIASLRDISHTMRSLCEGRGSQRRALIVLSEGGGKMTQSELTARLGIQPGSASETVSKLENSRYLVREPNQADRRTSYVELTAKGRAAAQEAVKQRVQRHEEMFACLDSGEKEALLRLLGKLNADWEERFPSGVRRHSGHGKGA